jgi:hypothetical protein
VSGERFTVKGTGRLSVRGAESSAQSVVIAAFAYLSDDAQFPAFRRWCMEHAAGSAMWSDWFVAMSPMALRGLAEAFADVDLDQP